MTGGYNEEALAWRDWLLRAAAGDPSQLQIMYGLGGERRLDEYEIGWLPGYEGSAPVRVGNAASEQFQLDVYGETLASLGLMRGRRAARQGRSRRHPGRGVEARDRASSTTSRVPGSTPTTASGRCAATRQHFTHSKVMAWLGFDERGAGGRGVRPPGPDRPLARGARRGPRAGAATRASTPSSARSRRRTARSSSTPRCCRSRRPASSPRPTSGWSAPSPRSRRISSRTGSCCATGARAVTTGSRRARARSCPARSGSSATT